MAVGVGVPFTPRKAGEPGRTDVASAATRTAATESVSASIDLIALSPNLAGGGGDK